MAATRAPKQWSLGKVETVNTFNAWKDNLLYTLSLDTKFAPFLVTNYTWGKETTADPNRGFTDDAGANDNPPTGMKKEEKVKNLNLFLGMIANYATVISRSQILSKSTSLKDIWGKLREHYGLQTSGSKFIDLVCVRLNPGERYEDFYQRILTFFEDNLLSTEDNIKHHGEDITAREELTPSLENTVVLLWLERIHTSLPGLIKQRYGSELRNKTLASLKSEISQALDSLLDELKSSSACASSGEDNSRIMRASSASSRSSQSQRSRSPFCCLCHAAKRPNVNHWLSRCPFLPEAEKRRFQTRVRVVEVDDEGREIEDEELNEEDNTEDNHCFIDEPRPAIHRRVTTRKSPYLKCFVGHFMVWVCLDSGAESSLISKRFAISIGLTIKRATQGAIQADAKSPLEIVGEVSDVTITRGPHSFILDALVTERDFGDVIGGEPFLEKNDIAIRPRKKQIIIGGRDIVSYDNQ